MYVRTPYIACNVYTTHTTTVPYIYNGTKGCYAESPFLSYRVRRRHVVVYMVYMHIRRL